jgi:hypothetical protein
LQDQISGFGLGWSCRRRRLGPIVIGNDFSLLGSAYYDQATYTNVKQNGSGGGAAAPSRAY